MFKKAATLFLVVSLILTPALATAREALSLASVVEEARKNNPDILAAKKAWEASKAQIPQAGAWEDPTVTIDFQRTPKNPFNLGKTPADERMFSFGQVLPLFGKLPLKKKMAVVESQIAAAAYKQKELEVTSDVKKAYFDLFLNAKEKDLVGANVRLLESIARIAQARYSVDKLTQDEVFKILLEIANLKNTLINLTEEGAAQEARLKALLNRDQDKPLGASLASEDASYTPDMKFLYQAALLNQPELLMFSYAIEKNKYAKALTKRNYFSDVLAQITARGLTAGGIGPWDLMLAFSVPLWFWTKQKYQVREAIANIDQAQAAYKAMENKAYAEIRDLVSKIKTSQNNIELYKKNLIPLVEGTLAAASASFRAGQGDIMGLLDTARMLIETKMNYYKALVAYHAAVADLEREAGGPITEAK